ncbi:MAG: hypothetical protein Q8P56_04560, partial [Candidatus Uhrbacteria bacterium]|nr:hypothetical protein [Candidatus Uhrbacteria bacterium]
PFFEQFQEVRDRVPRVSLVADNRCINSPYVNHASAVKNCHILSASVDDEDCYYGYRVNHSKNCVDCLFANTCELCYECIEAYSSYNCSYCRHIESCTNSAFLFDCSGCMDCFMCAGLRNKSYCILNKQYSKEEYEKRRKEYRMDSFEVVEKLKQEFNAFIVTVPRRFAVHKNVENVTGDNVSNTKNCTSIFDAVSCENVSYAKFVDFTRDSMDLNYGYESELNYDSVMTGLSAYMVRFSTQVWPSVANIDYCDSCENISDCFGCIGLRKKQYCILNKQYTKEEYESLHAKLIEYMKEAGEWGEFFPAQLSPFAYNESTAMIFFPMKRGDVLANGWRWQDAMPGTQGKETLAVVPDSINEVSDTITSEVLACASCARNYKIIKQELAFYKQCGIPVPRLCPDCRLASRIALRNPTHLYHRQCMCEKADHDHAGRCTVEFETTYAPERFELVYCESCHQKEVV